MKNLLILPLLALLTSCVTYYTPETAMEDGVYYAEDDPAYVVFQEGYPGGGYYPWLTLDYFYLGYHPYPVYPYYHGFPFGLSYAYQYGYWGRYPGYCAHDRVCGGRYYGNRRNNGQNRYADNNTGNNRDGDKGETADVDFPDQDLDLDTLQPAGKSGQPYMRYISTMPAGYGGSRGMVIGHNESTKITESKVQPVASSGSSSGIIVTAAPSASAGTPIGISSGQNRGQPVGTSVISERPAQTVVPAGSSRSSNSRSSSRPSSTSGRSGARAKSGSSNRSRSSGRSSGSRSTKSSPPSQRKDRD